LNRRVDDSSSLSVSPEVAVPAKRRRPSDNRSLTEFSGLAASTRSIYFGSNSGGSRLLGNLLIHNSTSAAHRIRMRTRENFVDLAYACRCLHCSKRILAGVVGRTTAYRMRRSRVPLGIPAKVKSSRPSTIASNESRAKSPPGCLVPIARPTLWL
jgi:hypothetical protein